MEESENATPAWRSRPHRDHTTAPFSKGSSLATGPRVFSGTRRRAGDVLVRLIRRRRAPNEPVAWPSGRSRHVSSRYLDADARRAVATWAGRNVCACRRSTRQRHGTCHDQTCERFTPYAPYRHFYALPFCWLSLYTPEGKSSWLVPNGVKRCFQQREADPDEPIWLVPAFRNDA